MTSDRYGSLGAGGVVAVLRPVLAAIACCVVSALLAAEAPGVLDAQPLSG
ncbi:hypothetical protein MSM1_07905 [Mycobacterium sp. SM1]|nr:hypothetical protein [Mycobacterium sp. SM1]MBS4728249.1 hypothetical protein [Mycobacterium sp. SM1]MBS4728269.1 hypothetical protein [Mycobacterium sp. SM1]